MPLAFVLDENQRGLLWRYVQRHNAKREFPIDAVRVGDAFDLPLGADDRDVLIWAERENRIIVTSDRNTFATHLAGHVKAGRRCPGVFQSRDTSLPRVVDFLACAAYASEPSEWENRIVYVP